MVHREKSVSVRRLALHSRVMAPRSTSGGEASGQVQPYLLAMPSRHLAARHSPYDSQTSSMQARRVDASATAASAQRRRASAASKVPREIGYCQRAVLAISADRRAAHASAARTLQPHVAWLTRKYAKQRAFACVATRSPSCDIAGASETSAAVKPAISALCGQRRMAGSVSLVGMVRPAFPDI